MYRLKWSEIEVNLSEDEQRRAIKILRSLINGRDTRRELAREAWELLRETGHFEPDTDRYGHWPSSSGGLA